MVVLSVLYVTRLSRVVLHESHARGQLLANTIWHRAREVALANADVYPALRSDPGLRAILESSLYGESVTGAAIIDTGGNVVAHSDGVAGAVLLRAGEVMTGHGIARERRSVSRLDRDLARGPALPCPSSTFARLFQRALPLLARAA